MTFLSVAGFGRAFAQRFKTLFTLLSFSSQMKKGEPLTGWLQHSLIVYMNRGSFTQSGLKRKGMGPRSRWASSSSFIGLWSEMLHGRICILDSSPRSRKELWMKNLSSLAAICPGPILLLDHENLPVEGLMSIKSHSCRTSSAHSLAGSRTMLPPLFSDEWRVRLRSPAMITFSRLVRSACRFIVSQHSFFSLMLTGECTLKIVMVSFVSRFCIFNINQ